MTAAATRQRFSGVGFAAHRRLLLKDLIPSLIDHPFEQLTLVSLARLSGISLWVLRRAFGNASSLLSAATAQAIEDVLGELDFPGGRDRGVLDSILRYAHFLAARMQTSAYRSLLMIIVRNSSSANWVSEAYSRRIIGKICSDLEGAIADGGRAIGTTVLIKKDAANRFYKRIETAIALPHLLPANIDLSAGEIDQVLQEIARETFANTYVLEWEPKSATPRAINGAAPSSAEG